jgi:hypothetical protein
MVAGDGRRAIRLKNPRGFADRRRALHLAFPTCHRIVAGMEFPFFQLRFVKSGSPGGKRKMADSSADFRLSQLKPVE